MNYGFVRVASAIPAVKVGDCKYNAQQIESLIIQAEGKGVEIICFPELSTTPHSLIPRDLQARGTRGQRWRCPFLGSDPFSELPPSRIISPSFPILSPVFPLHKPDCKPLKGPA